MERVVLITERRKFVALSNQASRRLKRPLAPMLQMQYEENATFFLLRRVIEDVPITPAPP